MYLIVVPHIRWDREREAPFERCRHRLTWLMDDLIEAMEAPGGLPYFMMDGQTSPALDYLAARPEHHDRLLALVETGRVEVGPWHIAPNPCLVSQESLVRNLARGLADAARLGGPMLTGYLPDAFGQPGQMPQLLCGFGIETAVVWRGVPANLKRAAFHWEAPDGSRVLAVALPLGDDVGTLLPEETDALAKRLRDIAERLSTYQPILILAGGDYLPPPPGLPAALERLRQRKLAAPSFVEGDTIQAGPEQFYDWEIGRLADYIVKMRAETDMDDLPVHRGELCDSQRLPLATGAASARIPSKQHDFKATRLMEAHVEPLAAWCLLCGFMVERRVHGRIWNLLLRCQAQPSISGTASDAVQYDIDQRYHRATQLMNLLVEEYTELIASIWNIPDPPAQALAQLAAFNPAGPRPAEACTGTLYLDKRVRSAALQTEAGEIIDAQLDYIGEEELFVQSLTPEALLALLERPLEPFLGLHVQRGHLRQQDKTTAALTLILGERPNPGLDLRPAAYAFLEAHPETLRVILRCTRGHAHEVTFVQEHVAPGQVKPFALVHSGVSTESALSADDRMLTNAFYRLTWDGEALRLFDRQTGRRFGPLNLFSDVGDRGDLFTFCPLPVDAPIQTPTSAEAAVIAAGPVYAAWRFRYTYELPVQIAVDRASRHRETSTLAIETVVKLYAGLDRIDFCTRLRNRAEDHRLRVGMMTPIVTENVWCDNPFELVRRPIAQPEAGRNWAELPAPTHPINGFAALSDNEGALLLTARGLREVEAVPNPEGDGVTLWLTLLRCVGQLSRHDLETRPAGGMPHMPALAVPDAQLSGVYAFDYSITVLPEPVTRAALWDRLAAYQMPSLVRQVEPNAGSGMVKNMWISDPDIEWSALKPADNYYDAVILRLVNKRASQKSGVQFRPGDGIAAVFAASLREEPENDALPLVDGEVLLDFAPYEIKTLYLALPET